MDPKFTVCLTHDVDRVKKTYQHFTHYLKTKDPMHLNTFFTKKNPYWCFDIIIEIEEKYDVKSTYFFLNESINFSLISPNHWKFSLGRYDMEDSKITEMIKLLDCKGFEIGLHGSIRSYNDYKLMKREKDTLEKILGKEIKGIRQHHLRMNYPRTWFIQNKLGFKYDSSFGYRHNIGFKNKKYSYFNPLNNGFKVLPITIMDGYLFKDNSSLEDKWKRVLDVIDESEKNSSILVILWHQRVFSGRDFPNYKYIYTRIIEECLNRGATFKTCSEALELNND